MLSSDQNVETIAELIEAGKHYLGLQAEYVKLDTIDKLVRLLTNAVLIIIMLLMLVVVLVSLSLSLASWLSSYMSMPVALLAVAGLQVLLLLFINTVCRPWIEKRLVRYLARLLLK
jgi:fatty acid desaturase